MNLVDDDRAAVIYRETSDVIGFVPRIGHITFEPWDAGWSSDVSLGQGLELFRGPIIAIGASHGPRLERRVGAALELGSNDAVGSGPVAPGAVGIPLILEPVTDPRPPILANRDVIGWNEQIGQNLHELRTKSGAEGPRVRACASSAVAASMQRVDQFENVLAHAAGTPWQACEDVTPGPPNDLQVILFFTDGELIYEQSGDAPMLQVEVAWPWVLWQRDGGVQPTPVRAVRFDENYNVVVGPIDVAGDGQVALPFAATALRGDRLVFAWTDATDPSAPSVGLDVFSAEGQRVGGTLYQPPGGLFLSWPYTLAAQPNGDRFLLSFPSITVDTAIAGTSGIYVERFSCSSS